MPKTTKASDGAADKVKVEVTLGVEGDAERNPLAVIRGISTGMRRLEEPLRDAVQLAREQRRTWTEIGDALGVTRQSAWERFGND